MRPALRVRDPGLVGIGGVGGVAIGEQHRAVRVGQPKGLLDMLGTAAFEVREAHLVVFTVHRPVVGGFHLPG